MAENKKEANTEPRKVNNSLKGTNIKPIDTKLIFKLKLASVYWFDIGVN